MQRFNKWLALKITDSVATMWCAYLFALLALSGLPTALKPSGIGLIQWISTAFLQLVLLSIILVGQKLQADATIKHVTKKHDESMKHISKIHKHLGIKK